MSKSKIQEILEGVDVSDIKNWVNPGNHDKVNIALGLLNAEKTTELTNAISNLRAQIPITISELRSTISQNTDKIITSNEKLGKSNENYALWIKWLTLALVLVGVVQVLVVVFKK